MKLKIKKIFALLLLASLSVGLRTNVSAMEATSPYQQVLNEINKEYKLSLGYIPVDKDKISQSEYEEKTREFAIEQRELLNYIKNRKNTSEQQSVSRYALSKSTKKTKTKTKSTWELKQYFTITATYDVYDGKRISSCRNAKLNITTTGNIRNTYLTDISKPSYSVIDGGRTSTVKYTATVHLNNIVGYKNTVLYTEFYYSE